MKSTSSLLILFSALSSSSSVAAISIPIVGTPRSAALYQRKAQAPSGVYGNGSIPLENYSDVYYSCNITLGGKEFTVEIDTGSTDLWVQGEVPGTKNLSVASNVSYAKGGVEGFINTVTLGLDSFTVYDQAYILVESTMDLNLSVDGIIGLGPSNASGILANLNGSRSGDPPLDRIFTQNLTTPNYISFLLSRNPNESLVPLAEQWPGQLTIGELIPGLEDISKSAKLPALVDQYGIQHWETLLDPNGIIGPDGQKINTMTAVENPTAGEEDQLHVVFDSGYTFPQLPRNIVDAIYGRVPGAVFIQNGSNLSSDFDGLMNFWRVPCTYELNVSFIFAGVEYPISPLDLTWDSGETDSNGIEICFAAFQQAADIFVSTTSFGAFDAILGMAFLRNTYILINFGDFVDGSGSSVADPYIQLLSVSNKANIHKDFVNARLNGTDSTGFQPALLPPLQAKRSN